VPCFHNLRDDQFTPIGPRERAFIEAIVALTPEALAPVLTQLNNARTCDDGTGWLVLRYARGEPCKWPDGYPFDVPIDPRMSGAQGCLSIMLWFHGDGQLHAVELLMLENAPLELEALTTWLVSERGSSN
jgi:hypothetical protein